VRFWVEKQDEKLRQVVGKSQLWIVMNLGKKCAARLGERTSGIVANSRELF